MPARPARRRLLADEDRRRHASRTPAARPTCRPTSRSACGTTGCCTTTSRSYVVRGRRCARGLDFVAGLQLPFGGIAWSQQDDGVVNARRPGRRQLEHLPRAAGRARARRPGGGAAAGLGARGRAAAPRAGEPPRPVPGQVDVLDGLVLPGARRPAARRRRSGAARRAAGTTSSSPGLGARCVDTNPWVTGAETCELVLALDVVGDPRALAGLRRHAAPAPRGRALLDRLGLRRRRQLARRADDVHLGGGDPGRRRPVAHHAGAPASSAATASRRTRRRWPCTARAAPDQVLTSG